ncbi:DNA-directed RNA polymerase subunit E'/Rpb7 [Methanonatronarchaeum thermophilum]|uniref:DNA-directed RNA polymerase subunit Rpo7 n=1 Tax=Methanonatronarchaeum thermophilum TaxID=1927129 RepID=A0A1Y3GBM3_9EURY|nr:DNA-directed RNA polymerase [Methanonatronarchaeum thermophilum]OUJ18640.1 DNA-directed RNA polymerase subunit E'/Rpb7 [Methanonatronarchaeum thermophilum]
MYRELEAIDTVRVPPTRLDEPRDKVIKEMLENKIEGKIDRKLGMFVAVTEITEAGGGKLIPNDAGVYYNVTFKCITYRPEMQEIIEGEVVEIVDFGAFIGIGPMDALLHVSQITSDYVSYDEKNARLVGKESDFSLDEGDYVTARIIAVSLNEQDPKESKIGLTMRQPVLGKIDKDEEKAEKTEVQIRKVIGEDKKPETEEQEPETKTKETPKEKPKEEPQEEVEEVVLDLEDKPIETDEDKPEKKESEEVEEESEEVDEENEFVECRVCGKEYKAITGSHLATHDLDMDEYREEYPDAPIRPGD